CIFIGLVSLSLRAASPHPPAAVFPYSTLFRSPHSRRSIGFISSMSFLISWIEASWSGVGSYGNRSSKDCCISVSGPYLKPCACRSEEHTSELQSRFDFVCRLLLEKENNHLLAR